MHQIGWEHFKLICQTFHLNQFYFLQSSHLGRLYAYWVWSTNFRILCLKLPPKLGQQLLITIPLLLYECDFICLNLKTRVQKQPSNKHLSDVCHPPSKRQILTFQCGKAEAERGPVSEFGGTFKTHKSVTYALLLEKPPAPPSLSPPHPGQPEPEVAQSCPTLCDPMDYSLPGFSVHGIFQARVLEWGAISFSRGSSRPRDWTQVSCIVGRRFYPLSHQGSRAGIFTQSQEALCTCVSWQHPVHVYFWCTHLSSFIRF